MLSTAYQPHAKFCDVNVTGAMHSEVEKVLTLLLSSDDGQQYMILNQKNFVANICRFFYSIADAVLGHEFSC